MGNPETAKKLFWKFFGHGPKSHLVTQKIFFFRYLFCTFPAILRPLKPPWALGGTSKPLKPAWGAFLRKLKIHPKSAFFAGGGKGALAAWGSHMRLVSTKLRPWGLIYGLGATLGGSGGLCDDFQKSAKNQLRAPKKVTK